MDGEEAVVGLVGLLRPHLAPGAGVAHGEVLLEVGVDEVAALDGGVDAVLLGAEVALLAPDDLARAGVEGGDQVGVRGVVLLQDLGDHVHLPRVHRDRPRLAVLLAEPALPGLLAGRRVVTGDRAVVRPARQVQRAVAEQQRGAGGHAVRQRPALLAGGGVPGGERRATGDHHARHGDEFVVVPVGLGRHRLAPQRLRRLPVLPAPAPARRGLLAPGRLVAPGRRPVGVVLTAPRRPRPQRRQRQPAPGQPQHPPSGSPAHRRLRHRAVPLW